MVHRGDPHVSLGERGARTDPLLRWLGYTTSKYQPHCGMGVDRITWNRTGACANGYVPSGVCAELSVQILSFLVVYDCFSVLLEDTCRVSEINHFILGHPKANNIRRLRLGAVTATRTYISPENDNKQPVTLIKRWLFRVDNFLRNPLIARWKGNIWAKWDMILRFSSSPEATVLEEWNALSWLIRHQNVPSDLVVQCFSDIPGPPPPTLANQDMVWLEEKEWVAVGEMGSVKLQFRYECQVLLSLLKQSERLPELKNITDLQAFFSDNVWQIKMDEQQRNPTFDINKSLLYRFWIEVQHISPLTRNAILQCISSLTRMISDRHLFFSNKIEFDFFANLLGAHFLLVTNRDPNQAGANLYDLHHNTLITILSTDLLNMNSRKNNRLTSFGSTGKNNNYLNRIEFAANLLSFAGSQYFCGTSPWKLEGDTMIHVSSWLIID
jgi:hypothetical protein